MGNNRSVGTLDELLQALDFVSLHVPATHNQNLMALQLEQMKKGSYLNASRGTVVDIPALAASLKKGHLAGAAIDVFPVEPATNDNPSKANCRGSPTSF